MDVSFIMFSTFLFLDFCNEIMGGERIWVTDGFKSTRTESWPLDLATGR